MPWTSNKIVCHFIFANMKGWTYVRTTLLHEIFTTCLFRDFEALRRFGKPVEATVRMETSSKNMEVRDLSSY